MTKKHETYYRSESYQKTASPFKTQLKGELTIIISQKIKNRNYNNRLC